MKFLNVAVVVLAYFLIPSQAITRPDAVLAQLDLLENKVFSFQHSLQESIRLLRKSSADQFPQFLLR